MNLDASGAFAGLESKFTVPERGSWSVVIRRATPKPSIDPSTCYTYIQFGKFLIVIPYVDGQDSTTRMMESGIG
jgi:hypothetical protein